jgi:hypothetical protein
MYFIPPTYFLYFYQDKRTFLSTDLDPFFGPCLPFQNLQITFLPHRKEALLKNKDGIAEEI